MALRIGWGTGDLVASRGGGAVLAARTTRLAGWSGDCGARGPQSGSVHPHSSRVCQGEAGSRSLLFPALLHALRPDQAQPVQVSFDSCHEEKACAPSLAFYPLALGQREGQGSPSGRIHLRPGGTGTASHRLFPSSVRWQFTLPYGGRKPTVYRSIGESRDGEGMFQRSYTRFDPTRHSRFKFVDQSPAQLPSTHAKRRNWDGEGRWIGGIRWIWPWLHPDLQPGRANGGAGQSGFSK